MKRSIFFLPILMAGQSLLAQTDSTSAGQSPTTVPVDSAATTNVFDLSLEDLMNTPIVSASKEKESSFDAPLTSCVITRQEINNMGATSIPDALRFCPALIVREVANGSYDVSIRGGIDGLPSYQYQNINTTILAMIDNRPVFSSFQGGTYWQNLPVEVADVERIEVVYGPNAPMYGPNAVSGVINIITKKDYVDKNTIVHANLQRGLSNIYSAYVGKKLSDKLDVSVSGNYTNRQRQVTEYYIPNTDTYTNNVNLVSASPDTTYPLQNDGVKKMGLNFNANYAPTSKVNITYNTSYNKNMAWGLLQAGHSMSVLSNTSNSHMLRAEAYNFSMQTSILTGNQGLVGNEKAFSHDYTTQDYYLDYNLKLFNNKVSIRPAVAYQNAYINDQKYTTDVNKRGLFNSKANVENLSASLKFDCKPVKWIRAILAGRVDKFSQPDKVYPSYQAALNIKPSVNHNIRFAAGRSYNGSFVVSTFADFNAAEVFLASVPSGAPGLNTDIYYILNLKGGPNRSLLQNDMVEIGYRGQLGKNVQLDASLFYQEFQNLNVFVNQIPSQQYEFYPNSPVPSKVSTVQQSIYKNLDTRIYQKGITLAVLLVTNNKRFSLKPNITLQETRVANYQTYYYEQYANFGNPNLDLNVSSNIYGKGTPSWFGGCTFNVNPFDKLNLGLSAYYYDQTYMTTLAGQPSNLSGVTRPTSNDLIREKAIFNAHVTYKVYENITLGFNARNFLNNDSREGWGSDRLGAQYFATLIVNY
jgi:iron complex outermembrane recepter protein